MQEFEAPRSIVADILLIFINIFLFLSKQDG